MGEVWFAWTMENNKSKYNVCDEYGRVIEENISEKRALETVALNPGSVKVEIKTTDRQLRREKTKERL